MDFRKNIEHFIDNLSLSDKIIFVTAHLLIVSYYIFRPSEATIFLICYWTIFTLFHCVRIKPNPGMLKGFITLVTILFLIFSYFNTRTASYDGLNVHLKYILQIQEKGFVGTTEYPVKPYLGELLLTGVYDLFGLRGLNSIFGILVLVNIFLIYNLIKCLATNNDFVRKLSLFIVVLSPSFLGMALQELKIDLILSATMLSALILFCKLVKDKKHRLFPLITILSGISIVIKPSSAVTSLCLLLLGLFVVAFSSKLKFPKRLLFGSIGCLVFALPILIWTMYFGGTIPQLENRINIKPIHNQGIKQISLSRNKELLSNCTEDRWKKDYSSFIYGSRSLLVLAQPFFYITRLHAYPFSAQGMANPGILLYLGILVFLALPFLTNIRRFSSLHKYFYIITLGSTLAFLIMVSSIYWYLLYLFPIFALVISSVIDRIKDVKLKEITKLTIYSTLLTNLIIALLMASLVFEPIPNLNAEVLKKSSLREVYDTSNRLNQIPEDGFILDASEHRYNVLTTFVSRGDMRIVKSNYYFAASNLSLKNMRDELLKNNIKYLIVYKNKLKDPWYKRCPKLNNKILAEFMNEYTYPMYPNDPKYKDLIFVIR